MVQLLERNQMQDLELIKEYILEKRLVSGDNLQILRSEVCHCGSAENFYIAGLTHQKVTFEYWKANVHTFKSVCIHPYLFPAWSNVKKSRLRDEKINQLLR